MFFLAVNLKSIYNEFSFKQTAACRINSQRQLKIPGAQQWFSPGC